MAVGEATCIVSHPVQNYQQRRCARRHRRSTAPPLRSRFDCLRLFSSHVFEENMADPAIDTQIVTVKKNIGKYNNIINIISMIYILYGSKTSVVCVVRASAHSRLLSLAGVSSSC